MQFPMSAGRFLVAWSAMALAMSINGIGRELVLRRVLAGRQADIASAAIGIALIGLITWIAFRPLALSAPSSRQLALMSVMLLVMTVAFECALGRYVDHKTWQQILAHYAIWRGELWPIVLLWLMATPFIWSRGWPRV